MPRPKLKPRNTSHIDVKVKSRGNDELKMNLVKDKSNGKKKEVNNPELESILNELNTETDSVKNDYHLKYSNKEKSIFEYLDTPKKVETKAKTIEKIMDDSGYNEVEIKQITSPENLKHMVNKITDLQKPEWIEIFRIIKNNEPKNYQENNNGIWIILNKLQKDTIIKLHKFVNYCIKSKTKLEQEKIKISKIKDDLRGGHVRNDEEFIKESQLLKDMENDDNIPSGYANSEEGIADLHGDNESNLKQHVELEDNKLTNVEIHNLLSERMMMRDMDDESFLT